MCANCVSSFSLMSDYEVTLINDNMQEFYVRFVGPTETPFEGGVWKIHVELPDQYPYKSPSIGFVNKIFHPNIDELSGSVCLDVINQTWSPMFGKYNSIVIRRICAISRLQWLCLCESAGYLYVAVGTQTFASRSADLYFLGSPTP